MWHFFIFLFFFILPSGLQNVSTESLELVKAGMPSAPVFILVMKNKNHILTSLLVHSFDHFSSQAPTFAVTFHVIVAPEFHLDDRKSVYINFGHDHLKGWKAFHYKMDRVRLVTIII